MPRRIELSALMSASFLSPADRRAYLREAQKDGFASVREGREPEGCTGQRDPRHQGRWCVCRY